MKRVFTALIAVLLIVSAIPFASNASGFSSKEVGSVEAEYSASGTPVKTVEEFVAMSDTGNYYLANDIDFSAKTYTGPVYTKTFKGMLDGNGYSLLGITVKVTNNDAGIFGNSFSGTLKNLSFGSASAPVSVTSTGSDKSVACVAGTAANGANFENVRIFAVVKGDGKTAGLFSYMPDGTVTVNGCEINGSISGNPAAGFITLSPDGGTTTLNITNCRNNAVITAKGLSAGGIYTASGSTVSGRTVNANIKYCSNSGIITATDWRSGGIVGEFNETAASKLVIDYCRNTGDIIMTGGGGYAGGILGGCFNDKGPTMKISHVYNSGDIKNTANAANAFAICYATHSRTQNNVSEAYYTEGKCSENFSEVNCGLKADAQEIYSAISSWKLDDSDTPVFIQDDNNQNKGFPIFSWEVDCTHTDFTQYPCGEKVCNDCGKHIESGSNHNFTNRVVPTTQWVDGYTEKTCTHCGVVVIESNGNPSAGHVTPTDKGVYEISSALNLMWYANMVNTGMLKGGENVLLTADIDLTGFDFIPIANNTSEENQYSFSGIFDGGFHKISNMKITKADYSQAGLFGLISGRAKICNLHIDNAEINAKSAIGAIVGEIRSTNIVTVEACVVTESKISASEGKCGSVIGMTENAASVVARYCLAAGVTIEGKNIGSLAGTGNSISATDCYMNVTLKASDSSAGSIAMGDLVSCTNCYYVKSNNTYSKKAGSEISEKLLASGEIAYKLYLASEMTAWGQDIGKDKCPTFNSKKVTAIRKGTEFVYTSLQLTSDDKNYKPYLINEDGAYSLFIVVKKHTTEKYVDTTIKVNAGTTEKSYSALKTVKAAYTVISGTHAVPASGYAAYKLPLGDFSTFTSLNVTIGTSQFVLSK